MQNFQGETISTNRPLTAKFNIDYHEIKIDQSFPNSDDKNRQTIILPTILFDLKLQGHCKNVIFNDINQY